MSFYAGKPVFPDLHPDVAAPATVPIIRQSAVVPPESLPVDSIQPASPAGFAPFMIRPEVQGALPQKQIVPPLWGEGTAASFVGKGIFSQRVDPAPVVPPGASPIEPPGPIFPFFTTTAINKERAANTADLQASISARRATELQNIANDAAFQADKHIAKAAVDPSPSAQGAAKAADDRAAIAQQQADAAAKKAVQHDLEAQEAIDKANAAAAAEAYAAAKRAQANEKAVAKADAKAMDQPTDFIWPDGKWGPPAMDQPPEALPNIPGMSSVPPGYTVPVGGGAVAGFLLGGPVGALLGALLGGGYTYVKRH